MSATVVDQLAELDDDALTERFRTLELEHRRLVAEQAAIIAEGERRNIAAVDNHHSMKGWLKANANGPTATRHVPASSPPRSSRSPKSARRCPPD